MSAPSGGRSRLVLRPLSVADREQALDAQAALAAEGSGSDLLVEPSYSVLTWADYLAFLAAVEGGTAEGRNPGVAELFRVAVVDGVIVGRVAIKPTLTPWLAAVGGHIGYAVVPAQRRRGYATEILRQSLQVVAGYGVDPALLTCDDVNVASARTIEACGGVLESRQWIEDEGIVLRRYWVPTA